MVARFRIFFATLFALSVLALVGSRNGTQAEFPEPQVAAVSTALRETSAVASTTPNEQDAAPVDTEAPPAEETSEPVAEEAPGVSSQTSQEGRAVRIENPYSFGTKTPVVVDAEARAAVVNIFCRSRDPQLLSTSGSGVLIDPRGVILTNAHLGQYFLLDSGSAIDLSCSIRTGSPVRPTYRARVLYLPKAWVEENAPGIAERKATGSGEYDFSLLLIDSRIDGAALPATFPFLPPDTREAIGFTDDVVLVAGYPAEFLSGGATQNNLSITTTFATIGELLTFTRRVVDVISLGNIPLAQGGSSGGAVVNAWGFLVGIVTTTSEGETTASRDLRAITLAHVDRSLTAHTGADLSSFLSQDLPGTAQLFEEAEAPALSQRLIDAIRNR